jgi:hypothetical protein
MYETLTWKPFGLLGVIAYSRSGRYEVVPHSENTSFVVKRNGRRMDTALSIDSATRIAQADADIRATRRNGRRS